MKIEKAIYLCTPKVLAKMKDQYDCCFTMRDPGLTYWLWCDNMDIIMTVLRENVLKSLWIPCFWKIFFNDSWKDFDQLKHFFVAVGVRLQRTVVERDGDPVHRVASPRPGGDLRPLCQGETFSEKTEIVILCTLILYWWKQDEGG